MIVDSAHYKEGVRQHEDALTPERAAELRNAAGSGEFVWIGIHEPESGDLEQLQALFGLHELAVEDAQQAHQRPKIEDYGEDIFAVLKTAHYHEDQEEVHFGEIHLFAGPGYVITVRHGPGSELASARQRLEARPDLVKLGAASAIWAVIDKVVDDYLPVVDAIEDDIEEVEKEVFDDDVPAPTSRIYHLKREVIEFHRAVWPRVAPRPTPANGG
jgi:magnesium transporter